MERLIDQIHLVDSEDNWSWELDLNGVFSVASTRRALDDHFLDEGDRPTRWSQLVPIKDTSIDAFPSSEGKLPIVYEKEATGNCSEADARAWKGYWNRKRGLTTHKLIMLQMSFENGGVSPKYGLQSLRARHSIGCRNI
uniref:RNA-directed DNA polymerase, eukaryota n=1 Tax=Tanacetum cinerariifolium TaxID=118510 RepID=A0A6L2NU38_TANCI|nr:RNA-directed DNA polymerase, eukaryota [Tanacetum cinerariifolium]